MTTSYHNPVLLNESIEGLKIRPNGTYLDMTFGGGGHSRQILNNLSKGRLFAFDQDIEKKKNIFNDNRFKLIHSNFRYVKRFLKLEKIIKVDGVIADLGVSSFQIDTPSRGFSFRYDAELDMRMNVLHSLTAKEIINNYKEEKLAQVFYEYGELRNSKKLLIK